MVTVNLHDLVVALSEALGLVGGKIVNHGKRVAYLALSLSEELGVRPEEFDHLRTAALLHDAGVSCTRVRQNLMQLDWEGAAEHCVEGAALLSGFSAFSKASQIIYHHHERWEKMRDGRVDSRVALLANLVFMADRIDTMIDWNRELILNRQEIEERIRDLSGTFFNPVAIESFLKRSRKEVFWLKLYPRHLSRALSEFRPTGEIQLDLHGLEAVARIFALIVDNKSPFTRHHSDGVARLCRFMGEQLGYPENIALKLSIAGLLHDLGKLAIPDEILEKPSDLSADEFLVVKRHPFETYYILSAMPALYDIRDWASFHHEKMDGDGYPFHLTAQQLTMEHVIVMLSDAMQALIQDRPYRPGLSGHQVLDILEHMGAGTVHFKPLVDIIRRNYETMERLAQGGNSEN